MNLLSEIKDVVSDNCCVIGMGNLLKSDDAVGIFVIESVRKAVGGGYMLFNVEDVIEAYVYTIAELNCTNIVVVDAVKADAETGSIIFGKLEEEFDGLMGTFSTHKLSLRMSGRIFKEHNKETYLLGIAVDNIDFGAELSPSVRESAGVLIQIITDALKCKKGASK